MKAPGSYTSSPGFHALDFSRFNSVVLCNTKCACTLLKFLYMKFEMGKDVSRMDDESIHFQFRVYDTFSRSEVRDYAATRQKASYLIVGRNPYKRIVSSFLDKKVYTSADASRHEVPGDCFRDFVLNLYKLRNGPMTLHTRRVKPLGLDLLPSYEKINIDRQDLVEALIDRWQLTGEHRRWIRSLPRYKQTRSISQSCKITPGALSDTPLSELRKYSRGSINTDALYVDETMQMIAEIYAEDFVFFESEKPY